MTARQRVIVVVLVTAILLGNGFNLLVKQQKCVRIVQQSAAIVEAQERETIAVSEDGQKHDLETCQLVHVNWATATELQTLPGIGPKLAQRIIEARQQAYFTQLQDLLRVSGIGPARLEQIAEHICLAFPKQDD